MKSVFGVSYFLVDFRIKSFAFLPLAVESFDDFGQFACSGVCLLVQKFFGNLFLQLLEPTALFNEGLLVLSWFDGAQPLLLHVVLATLPLVQYAVELHQLAVVGQDGRRREADARGVEESGGDLLRLTTDRVGVVALQEVGVYALERRVVAGQSRLLERTALGFVVAQEIVSVLRADSLQGAVELKCLDGCGRPNRSVRSALLPDCLELAFGHRLFGSGDCLFWHWDRFVLHWLLRLLLVFGRRVGVLSLSEVD